jgi:hypothetical protein
MTNARNARLARGDYRFLRSGPRELAVGIVPAKDTEPSARLEGGNWRCAHRPCNGVGFALATLTIMLVEGFGRVTAYWLLAGGIAAHRH